jgi:hypothetical protein
VQELARTHTPQAIEALVATLGNPRERVAAAVALLDRGWGKPTQPIAGDEERPAIIEFRWGPALTVATANPATPTMEATLESSSTDDGVTIEWLNEDK